MAKRALKELMEVMSEYDPQIVQLAHARATNRFPHSQLFSAKTHRLKKHIRDESQAVGVLSVALKIAEANGLALRLSADEKRLLASVGSRSSENPGK